MENSAIKAASCLPELVQKDRKGLWIFGESESKRRVIMIEKKNGSYGFTLQSYGVRYKHGNRETDFITYVNAVEKDGAAFHSGLREGDVILSINGQNMARVEHKSLVNFIRKCPTHLKMVVVSDERARKVELHMRYVHLQKKLHDKMKELEQLNWKEKEILAGSYRNPCGSPLGAPCLAVATSACCFCPTKTSSSSSTTTKQQSLILDEKEKSKTISTTTGAETTKNKDTSFLYDFYRKSQSNRELNHSDSTKRTKPISTTTTTIISQNHSSSNNNNNLSYSSNTNANGNISTNNTPSSKIQIQDKISISLSMNATAGSGGGGGGSGGGGGTGNLSVSTPSTSTSKHENSSVKPPTGICDRERDLPPKPKSWDNLMTTKSFGGYGFGFGYGYFPSKQINSHGGGGYSSHHVTHPHHHNHHSHCNHSHSNYYYNKTSQASQQSRQGGDRDRNRGGEASGPYGHKHGHGEHQHRHCPITYTGAPYQIVTTGKTIRPGTCEGNPGSSKTLPSMRGPGSSRHTPESFSKMEKTLSDSSLNSEHHKDFPKTMSYFNRSTENVRYSSDDEYDQYRDEEIPRSQHDIFV